jgi:hypothetical protein
METQFRKLEVHRKGDEFAGWPANYGLWSWGDEVVVVFARGKLGAKGSFTNWTVITHSCLGRHGAWTAV